MHEQSEVRKRIGSELESLSKRSQLVARNKIDALLADAGRHRSIRSSARETDLHLVSPPRVNCPNRAGQKGLCQNPVARYLC